VVNSSIIYVHILPYHTLVLYLYMYLSEITFLTNSSPIILIIKILSYYGSYIMRYITLITKYVPELQIRLFLDYRKGFYIICFCVVNT
jgi:hypothetical protein